MPVDIARRNRVPAIFEGKMDYTPHNLEAMDGYMTLVGPGNAQQGVHVKVYRTSSEHFAAVYPQKKVCQPLGVINLRNTAVERLHDSKKPGFILRERGYDTSMSLTFICDTPRDLDSWMSAFSSCTSPTLHQTSLPIVEEDEET